MIVFCFVPGAWLSIGRAIIFTSNSRPSSCYLNRRWFSFPKWFAEASSIEIYNIQMHIDLTKPDKANA